VKTASPLAFFARRWRGEVPAAALFWRDMLVVGTVINMAGSFLALFLLSQEAPLGVAAAVHFAPLPYNLFLFAALMRLRRRHRLMTVAAAVWLALMTLV